MAPLLFQPSKTDLALLGVVYPVSSDSFMESSWLRQMTLHGQFLPLGFGRTYPPLLCHSPVLLIQTISIAEVCSVILSGAVPMLPGFVKFVRGQEGSGAGPSYGLATSSRRRGNTGHLVSQGQSAPDQVDKGDYDGYYELGVMNDAHASVASLINGGQKPDAGTSIVKTVHIQTGYE